MSIDTCRTDDQEKHKPFHTLAIKYTTKSTLYVCRPQRSHMVKNMKSFLRETLLWGKIGRLRLTPYLPWTPTASCGQKVGSPHALCTWQERVQASIIHVHAVTVKLTDFQVFTAAYLISTVIRIHPLLTRAAVWWCQWAPNHAAPSVGSVLHREAVQRKIGGVKLYTHLHSCIHPEPILHHKNGSRGALRHAFTNIKTSVSWQLQEGRGFIPTPLKSLMHR